MDLTLLGYLFHLFLSCIWIAILKVELQSIVEEDSILGYHTNVLSERLQLEILQLLSINKDIALRWIINPEQQMQHGCLTEA